MSNINQNQVTLTRQVRIESNLYPGWRWQRIYGKIKECNNRKERSQLEIRRIVYRFHWLYGEDYNEKKKLIIKNKTNNKTMAETCVYLRMSIITKIMRRSWKLYGPTLLGMVFGKL